MQKPTLLVKNKCFDEEHLSATELTSLIHDQLTPEVERKIMNLAERLELKGKIEGKIEGKTEIAIRMLKEGTDPLFVSKMTQLSLDQIKELQKKY